MTTNATTTLDVHGMTCAACVTRVERALAKVPGVEKASVNLATERATVLHGGGATVDALTAAVRDAGYEAEPSAAERREDRPGEGRTDVIIALVFAAPLLLFSMLPWTMHLFMGWLGLVLTLPVLWA